MKRFLKMFFFALPSLSWIFIASDENKASGWRSRQLTFVTFLKLEANTVFFWSWMLAIVIPTNWSLFYWAIGKRTIKSQ